MRCTPYFREKNHLQTLGCDYGDFPAHHNPWIMCERTQHDVTALVPLVPRTLKARGLDATPLIQAKLRQVGALDALRAVDIRNTIPNLFQCPRGW